MLKVNDLSVSYGTTPIVQNLNMELNAAEILMLVGPTGCGKTTILQALAGLIPISSGNIAMGTWRASCDNFVPPEKRNVGMVFQDFALFPHLTVEQNVNFRLKDSGPADHWLNLLGLNALRNAKPGNLSGGQKQRVALARTLAHQPSFVLLDEPLSNLDAALKDSLRWEIRNALKSAGVPAIWVTHDQDEALSVGDRVGILKSGNLQQLASPENCFDTPANRFVARFLGEASFIKGRFHKGTVTTLLGNVPAIAIDELPEQQDCPVELLVRPDDLGLKLLNARQSQDTPAIVGRIQWVRYEGGSRLYAVILDDETTVKVRVSHENQIAPNDQVVLSLTSQRPLAAFSDS
ncbi:MAG: ABC transporter ATP-binding protein [Pseudomonadales bacterium]|nr:ABC transporter ATP-binding protein [Pseudomonadales bacterium]